MLSQLLTSNTRSEVFRILFDGLHTERYLREIERLTGVGLNSLQKEMKHLASLDLVYSRKDGNRVYYQANNNHPIYSELVSIVEKTVGLVAVFQHTLINAKIKCAFIFGSFCKK